MAQFRKKPVVINAFRMGIDPRPDWFQDKVTENEITTHLADDDMNNGPFGFNETYCLIKTLEGIMRGDYGDWIIQGVKGEIYPCKPDIFAETYEPVLPKASDPTASPSPEGGGRVSELSAYGNDCPSGSCEV